jgi:hypothetical protein
MSHLTDEHSRLIQLKDSARAELIFAQKLYLEAVYLRCEAEVNLDHADKDASDAMDAYTLANDNLKGFTDAQAATLRRRPRGDFWWWPDVCQGIGEPQDKP